MNNNRFPHRLSTGFDKKIFGVPVFPGSSMTPVHQSPPGGTPVYPHESDHFASHSFDENINSINNNSTHASSHWKLRHIDFIPAPIKTKKDEDYEKFSTLVEKANQWSLDNPQSLIFSCETVTWYTIDRPVYSDSGVMTKSMHSDKKTKVIRGLRVWYFIYDETFYEKTNCPGPFKLGYINFTLEPKAEPSFSALLAKVNSDMFKKNFSGKIVRLETLNILSDLSDADTCVWFEQPDKSRDYTSFIRILCSFKKDGVEEARYGDIGVRDFIPSLDNRTPHSQGYETYSDLWRKAARYLHTNPSLRFINAQSVFVKIKKDTDTQSMVLWDRCNHCEHGSAYGSLSGQKTEYFQVLRLIFYQPPASTPTLGGGPNAGDHYGDGGKKFFYKFFAPGSLKRPLMGAGADEQDPVSIESLYEDVRQLEDKINSWIVFSGAKVAGVETINTRLGTGGQEMFGPEATFVYNVRERNQSREPWRVNIRLVLEGEFKEVPVVWKKTILEQTVGSTTTLSGGFTTWD